MLEFIRMIGRAKREDDAFTIKVLFFSAVAVCTVFAAVALVQSRIEVNNKRDELAAIETQIKQQEAENTALQNLLDNGTDEYIERIARDELDMVMPGERVYIVRAGN